MRSFLLLASVLMAVAYGRLIPVRSNHYQTLASEVDAKNRAEGDAFDKLIQKYMNDGHFPRYGRSQEQKVSEAHGFLKREVFKSGIVGLSASIVDQGDVVLSRGYGLLESGNPTSQVHSTSLFQIGSLTKTFVTLGIGLLVDEGRVQWTDRVKRHYPELALHDPYVEEHLTIGDLLSMNSGLDESADVPRTVGFYDPIEERVAHLRYLKPNRSLREEYAYANINFEILGMVIQSVTGLMWHEFLQEHVFQPLNMTRTFGAASQVPHDPDMSHGHFVCGDSLQGPYHLVKSNEAELNAGHQAPYEAAGSIVSSADDMAKLLQTVLSKGQNLFSTPSIINSMITGKCPVDQATYQAFLTTGHHYNPDGNTLAAGYGLDFVTHGMWGHDYVEKLGDTAVHATRSGLSLTQQVGVVLTSNTHLPSPMASALLDHMRSYVMGIFLDVPKAILDGEYKRWREEDVLQPPYPGVDVCGLRFWRPTKVEMSLDEMNKYVGTYYAVHSRGFFGRFDIEVQDNRLLMAYGHVHQPLRRIQLKSQDGVVFLWEGSHPMLVFMTRDKDKMVATVLETSFKQQ